MGVLVDDQLALVAALGLISDSDLITLPVVTTYGFHARLLQPLVEQRAGRPKNSPLKAIVKAAGIEPAEAMRVLGRPDSRRLLIANPVPLLPTAVQIRGQFPLALLGAEIAAAAVELELAVRLTPRNYHGHARIVTALKELGVDCDCWDLEADEEGFLVAVEES